MGDSRRLLNLVMALTGLVLLSVSVSLAQATSGTILGSVVDTTGAVLPGVAVAITNTETGVSRTVLTNDVGLYRASNLIPGPYSMRAELAGFRVFNQSGLHLTVGQEMRVNITLQVGEITDEVTVMGAGQLVNTTSATMQELVDEVKVRELPLNGRDYLQLATLQPGVLQTRSQRGGARPQSGTGVNMSISGGRPNSNVFRLDGIVINDHANSSPGSIGGANLGVDSIREFSTLTNTYSAEYGRSSGGVVNAVLRSGTNEIHGSLFYFHRNDELDARNFFNLEPDPPEFRRHQFGATGGAPIARDRTFMFGSYEALREFRNLENSITVPTAAAKTGRLTGPDNVSGTADDVTVPVDPAVARYLAFYPDPNANIAGNVGTFFSSPGRTVEADFMTLRGDHQFTENAFMHASYLLEDAAIVAANGFLTANDLDTSRRQFLSSEFTYLASPTVINSIRIGYNRSNLTTGDKEPLVPELAVVDPALSAIPGQLPANIEISESGISTFPGGPLGELDSFLFESFQVYEDVGVTRGRHDLKFGLGLEVIRDRADSGPPPPDFLGTGELTFDSIADFLTNQAPTQFRSQAPGSDSRRFFRQEIWGIYAQDRIQMTSNFSLDLGLRWEMATNPTERNGKESKLVNLNDDFVVTGEGYYETPKLNFSPRLGFAWDLFGNGKTAVRGGFGVFHELHLLNNLTIAALRMPPFFLRLQMTDNDCSFTGGGFPGRAWDEATACLAAAQAAAGSSVAGLALDPIESDPSAAYRMQYNLNIQQELLENTVLMIGYVGGGARHLHQASPDHNLAFPVVEQDRLFFPFENYPTLASVINDTADPSFPGQDRRNPFWNRLGLREFNSNSYYNALQLGLNRRFTEDLRIQGSYTWSKSIDIGSGTFNESQFTNGQGPPYPFIPELNQGPSDYDVRQALTINGTWDLPANFSGATGTLLNGWQIGGIAQLLSGVPMLARAAGDRAHTLTGRTSTRSGVERPDLVPGRDPRANPSSGADKTLAFDASAFEQPGASLGGTCSPNETSAKCAKGTFAPQGVLGNLGRNVMTGPGANSFDFVLTKNTYVPTISEDFRLQFRAEFFNVLNRTNFDIPEQARMVVINSNGTRASDPGRITQTVINSREIQLGLKIIF